MTQIGILGGSFNPIHIGHLRLAVEALERLGLDRVDLVPCAVPPHKPVQGLLPFAMRVRLIELTIADSPGISVNPLESHREGPSYTWDTLTEYARTSPPGALHFLLGATDLLMLPQWRRGLELPSLSNLVVVPREASDLHTVQQFVADQFGTAATPITAGNAAVPAAWRFSQGTRLLYLPIPRMEVSASSIRYGWRSSGRLAGLLHPAALHELEQNRENITETWTPCAETNPTHCPMPLPS